MAIVLFGADVFAAFVTYSEDATERHNFPVPPVDCSSEQAYFSKLMSEVTRPNRVRLELTECRISVVSRRLGATFLCDNNVSSAFCMLSRSKLLDPGFWQSLLAPREGLENILIVCTSATKVTSVTNPFYCPRNSHRERLDFSGRVRRWENLVALSFGELRLFPYLVMENNGGYDRLHVTTSFKL